VKTPGELIDLDRREGVLVDFDVKKKVSKPMLEMIDDASKVSKE
jgi:hypothetical protein